MLEFTFLLHQTPWVCRSVSDSHWEQREFGVSKDLSRSFCATSKAAVQEDISKRVCATALILLWPAENTLTDVSRDLTCLCSCSITHLNTLWSAGVPQPSPPPHVP